jgi:hypothetical protein
MGASAIDIRPSDWIDAVTKHLTVQIASSHDNIVAMLDHLWGELVDMHERNGETVGIDVFDAPDHVVSQWSNE